MKKIIYWQRFRKAMELDKRSDNKKLSELFEVTTGAISNWNSGTRAPDYEKIFTFCERDGVNMNWILTGRGEIFLNNIKDSAPEMHEAATAYNASAPDYARIGKMLVDVVAASMAAVKSS